MPLLAAWLTSSQAIFSTHFKPLSLTSFWFSFILSTSICRVVETDWDSYNSLSNRFIIPSMISLRFSGSICSYVLSLLSSPKRRLCDRWTLANFSFSSLYVCAINKSARMLLFGFALTLLTMKSSHLSTMAAMDTREQALAGSSSFLSLLLSLFQKDKYAGGTLWTRSLFCLGEGFRSSPFLQTLM